MGLYCYEQLFNRFLNSHIFERSKNKIFLNVLITNEDIKIKFRIKSWFLFQHRRALKYDKNVEALIKSMHRSVAKLMTVL
jgi:hypothetical protein